MEKFNDGWQFTLDDGTAQTVNLPHDWLISDVKNLYKSGVGVYRKTLHIANAVENRNIDALRSGEKIFLHFDGAYQDSTLHVNGKKVGDHKHGYTAFYFDIAPFLAPGENEIALTLRYESPNSRWYSGAGIYRDCFIERKKAAHFTPNGIYITTRRERDNLWHIEIDAEVEGATEYEIRYEVLRGRTFFEKKALPPNPPLKKTEKQSEARFLEKNFEEGLGETYVSPAVLKINNPALWDIENPALYILKSELIVGGEVADTVETRFGFREISFSPQSGFFLNGRRVRINGACQHHDLGGLGAAFYKDAARRQLTLLKEMGVNAIRTAHNPPARGFMELCDEMGLLVQSEFTDIWRRPKTQFDYARFFDEWHERDVAAWVRRDRNCPSIIMWCVGNEIYDTHADADDGLATLEKLMREVRRHDPGNHAPATLSSNYLAWEPTQKCADAVKLVGYNYSENLYESHREKFPDWIIYGGETASTVQSRGIYKFPLAQEILSDDDMQCSALGNAITSWGARSTEKVIADHSENMGQFIWTGTDYIGEPTPYSTKNSYFGQIDTAGFAKDQFYFFKAAWRREPMIHLFPYWDWSPGQPIDVRVVSNAPRIELFLNGKSLGEGGKTGFRGAADAKLGDTLPGGKVANFIVPYEPGCLRAVAYDNDGNVLAEAVRNSFGDAAALEIKSARFGELVFAEIFATDADGYFCENANNRVIVNVAGGELLALDNGDSTDFEQYQGTDNRRLFSGKLLAIVKCGEAEPEISARFDAGDVRVRKIELCGQTGRKSRFAPDAPQETGGLKPVCRRDGFNITAKIHPAEANGIEKSAHTEAAPPHLSWRLTNAAGIDSPLGRLEAAGETATLHPLGDGEVYVRCGVSGADEKHFYALSVLPVKIEGVGAPPHLDPYGFISAGLFTRCNGRLTAGNERGMATSRTEISHIIFDDVDFGKRGADELTMWIFELASKPAPIEIWLGAPGEGRRVCEVEYHLPSKWNKYQPATYKLPEKICGLQTISFVFSQKVHLKGFSFKRETAIPFTAHDGIYGDSYKVTPSAIENIGNNVSITFDDMYFDAPANEIEIRYRLRSDKNSIRVQFTDEAGQSASNLLTLTASEDYSVAVLSLDTPFVGKGSLNFTFFPGSDIDLEMFRM
ncbi:MAG: DUF4982 domain-containing protein [Defluviitaleaceae bacterium]|nr:DUF4982 domain-containing protein [Defluviitaleaceae bacterium]